MTTLLPTDSAHRVAVAALRASYAAIPPGHQVRLAKRTSNLFRPRTGELTAGLDVSGLTGVISIDPVARTADVQGMCTYETLVAATLRHGLMPMVVPQLKTITLGGAVTGLGIESSSFRNGLPHESVLELDILTGAGELLTVSPTQYPDLFAGFPNSYGSLGYAVRLRIQLDPVRPFVGLRHVRFDDLDELATAIGTISAEGSWDGESVDFLDGVMFSTTESYLSLGRWVNSPAEAGVDGASDYTGQRIFYRSIRELARDCLHVADYLWRWDTDWFWCSGAFGVQNPTIRRLWPARYRRSDVYHRLIGLDHRFKIAEKIDRFRKLGPRERVVQDVEIPLEKTADFLRWFAASVGMSPVWLCPLQLRERDGAADHPWPLYPLSFGQLYVNAGFWGTVPIAAGGADGDVNRAVENAVAEHAGHKSLYSDAYYDRSTFAAIYGGEVYPELKDTYDPGHRLTGLYEKAVGRH
ncbi:MAG: FAD-binding oxidoreductase [Actinomycetota bacterium]|nr:FAD-binding oxidoreductase [Actinomycetota bacterium]MDQ2955652.1 FAD-binding oxidoreductase [Actinomycetota bacterium]